MILGFYYHITIVKQESFIHIPSPIGVFLSSLLNDVDSLIIFGHTPDENDSDKCDYKLKNDKVRFVNLGNKTSSWHRFIFHKKLLNQIKSDAINCDAILVRGPSPLAPFFYYHFGQSTKIFYLIVGDYNKTFLKSEKFSLRRKMIKFFDYIQDLKHTKAIANSTTFVNSIVLYNKYRNITKDLIQIKTTTISKEDIIVRDDSFKKNQSWINILYTGRLDLNKGLFEICEAIKILVEEGFKVRAHFVGWEDAPKHLIKKKLIKKINSLSLDDHVFIHGKQRVGPELNKYYQDCQLYVIPSYFESFPRTIWEAFANSLPVIASNVGSIPFHTSHKDNILLIQPKDVKSLKNAIKELISDQELRKKLIINGRECVKDVTLEKQTAILLKSIKENLN